MQTKFAFMKAAVSGSSKDSRSITWHQWQAEEPTESRIGRSSSRARARASAPQGYQSTGLSRCWSRYGLVSCAKRFAMSSHYPWIGEANYWAIGIDETGLLLRFS